MRHPFCVVGAKGVGKTTLLCKLVTELKSHGLSVAVIKHTHHDIEMDQPGTDTWHLRQAGADLVAIAAPNVSALLLPGEGEGSEASSLLERLPAADILLAEGFKQAPWEKVEVYRRDVCQELVCAEQELTAVVSDVPLPVKVPLFDLADVKGLADFLCAQQKQAAPSADSVTLSADGNAVELKPFVQDFLRGGILGMLSALKGIEEASELVIRIVSPSKR